MDLVALHLALPVLALALSGLLVIPAQKLTRIVVGTPL